MVEENKEGAEAAKAEAAEAGQAATGGEKTHNGGHKPDNIVIEGDDYKVNTRWDDDNVVIKGNNNTVETMWDDDKVAIEGNNNAVSTAWGNDEISVSREADGNLIYKTFDDTDRVIMEGKAEDYTRTESEMLRSDVESRFPKREGSLPISSGLSDRMAEQKIPTTVLTHNETGAVTTIAGFNQDKIDVAYSQDLPNQDISTAVNQLKAGLDGASDQSPDGTNPNVGVTAGVEAGEPTVLR